jgi:lactate dehydrogenase-like 2-hydroxyacid dehydrogenase
MKPSAHLVNVARGRVVDEAALVEALAGRRIAGAGIDVTVEEFVSLGHVWSLDDRAHAAVSHVGCARRNARQVLPPSLQLRICVQIPQNRGVFKSIEITNVPDNIK